MVLKFQVMNDQYLTLGVTLGTLAIAKATVSGNIPG